MTRHVAVVAILAMIFVAAHSQNPVPSFQPQPGVPSWQKNGFVPDAATAVKIAEAVLVPVYGEKKVLSERPFKATLEGDIWMVAGTLYCDPPGSKCNGGTAEVQISKRSGQILRMGHGK